MRKFLAPIVKRSLNLFPKSYLAASLLGPSSLRVALYHHISDSSSDLIDQLNITTPIRVFESHLDVYQRDYDVVDLDAVIEHRLPKRPLLITFDDAYRSVIDVAGPMLKRRSLPSVFFINSRPVFSERLMLDNLLCHLSARFGLAELECAITGRPAVRNSLRELKTIEIWPLAYRERLQLNDRLAENFDIDQSSLARESALYLRAEDVPKLNEYGIEAANHTRDHVHCRILDEKQTAEQIQLCNEEIEACSGRPLRAFSCPYGSHLDMTPLARRIGAGCGHDAFFLVDSRANRFFPPDNIWYRVSMQRESSHRLFIELEVLPRLRSLLTKAPSRLQLG